MLMPTGDCSFLQTSHLCRCRALFLVILSCVSMVQHASCSVKCGCLRDIFSNVMPLMEWSCQLWKAGRGRCYTYGITSITADDVHCCTYAAAAAYYIICSSSLCNLVCIAVLLTGLYCCCCAARPVFRVLVCQVCKPCQAVCYTAPQHRGSGWHPGLPALQHCHRNHNCHN